MRRSTTRRHSSRVFSGVRPRSCGERSAGSCRRRVPSRRKSLPSTAGSVHRPTIAVRVDTPARAATGCGTRGPCRAPTTAWRRPRPAQHQIAVRVAQQVGQVGRPRRRTGGPREHPRSFRKRCRAATGRRLRRRTRPRRAPRARCRKLRRTGPSLVLAQLETGHQALVHLVGAVGQPQRPRGRPRAGEREVVGRPPPPWIWIAKSITRSATRARRP